MPPPPPDATDEDYEEIVVALSAETDDALARADREGYPDWSTTVSWAERALRVVLHERDRAVLRDELPNLREALLDLLARVGGAAELDREGAARGFLRALPGIRACLAEDVEAAYQGDPAARSFGEIIVAYPGIFAIGIYRMAHVLVQLGVPQLPRILSEHAHGRTGIDIHPGAKIGRRFFIDHGTGIVIGETSEIGDDVRMYHGVTLGAFSPRRGQTLKGTKRHPTIGDGVTIYPGATILGGETVIGAGCVVNGNAYVTESVPPHSRVVPEAPRQEVRQRSRKTGAEEFHWEI